MIIERSFMLGFPFSWKKRSPEWKTKSAEKDKDWSELCRDLLSYLIFPRLSFIDQLSFRGVCKAWRSAGWINNSDVNLQTPAWVMVPTTPKTNPIAHKFTGMFSKMMWGTPPKTLNTPSYKVTDGSTNRCFIIDIPELEGCSILTARCGWLLVRGPSIASTSQKSSFPVFFLNPFTHHKVSIPDFVIPHGNNGVPADYIWVQLTDPPNSPNCVIFAIVTTCDSPRSIWTKTYRQGGASWTEQQHEFEVPPISRGSLFMQVRNGVFDGRAGVTWRECIFNFYPWDNKVEVVHGSSEGKKSLTRIFRPVMIRPFASMYSQVLTLPEGNRIDGFHLYGSENDGSNDLGFWMWTNRPAPISQAEVWIRPRWAMSPFE